MRRFMYPILTGLVLAYSAGAVADDLNPPAWRGDSGTTQTVWEFSTSSATPAPEVEINPYGSSSMEIYTGVGQSWQSTWGGRQGVWPLSGAIQVDIPNSTVANPYKDIWIQLTWTNQIPGGAPVISDLISGIGAELVSEGVLEATNEPSPVGESWIHSTYVIHIEPNPAFETIRIDGSIMVDELVIDTICAPEPGSLCLLSIATLLAVRRRKR